MVFNKSAKRAYSDSVIFVSILSIFIVGMIVGIMWVDMQRGTLSETIPEGPMYGPEPEPEPEPIENTAFAWSGASGCNRIGVNIPSLINHDKKVHNEELATISRIINCKDTGLWKYGGEWANSHKCEQLNMSDNANSKNCALSYRRYNPNNIPYDDMNDNDISKFISRACCDRKGWGQRYSH